jgi:hypothetical protein
MKIRELQGHDIDQIQKIHTKHYKDEFGIADLYDKNIETFVVTDDENKVICAASIRLILEAVLITDKDRTVRERREALFRVLNAAEFISKQHNFSQLHVFVQDEIWRQHLERVGFKPTAGQALVLLF